MQCCGVGRVKKNIYLWKFKLQLSLVLEHFVVVFPFTCSVLYSNVLHRQWVVGKCAHDSMKVTSII
jgi:hypothetical protein